VEQQKRKLESRETVRTEFSFIKIRGKGIQVTVKQLPDKTRQAANLLKYLCEILLHGNKKVKSAR